jgi:PKHD-type hydroxylase
MQDANKTVLMPQRPEPKIIEDSPYDSLTTLELFTPEECAQAISSFDDVEWSHEEVWRQSHVKFLQPDKVSKVSVFDRVLGGMLKANEFFQFEVDQFAAVQLARYEVGGFYDWHVDIGPAYMGNRKLSMTVQLSAPEAYEGGDLIVETGRAAPITMSREIGSATVFPSFVRHKVSEVTKGTRYSLVVWAAGNNRFR